MYLLTGKLIFKSRMINLKSINSLVIVLLMAFITGIGFLPGCRTAQQITDQSHIKISQPWVFSVDFDKAVYKTNMLVHGNELSGLTVIKKKGRSFRVVFMSEIGLKYYDMEFYRYEDSAQIHHVINILDRKPVLEMLENNYKLLFMIFPEKRSEKFYADKRTKNMIKEYRYKGQKSRYTYDSNFGMVRTIFDKKGGRNLSILIKIDDHLSPQTININQM